LEKRALEHDTFHKNKQSLENWLARQATSDVADPTEYYGEVLE